jgi:hypothetical protein
MTSVGGPDVVISFLGQTAVTDLTFVVGLRIKYLLIALLWLTSALWKPNMQYIILFKHPVALIYCIYFIKYISVYNATSYCPLSPDDGRLQTKHVARRRGKIISCTVDGNVLYQINAIYSYSKSNW